MSSKGLKQEKYFTIKKKTCIVSIYESWGSVLGWVDCTDRGECLDVVLWTRAGWLELQRFMAGRRRRWRLRWRDEHQYNASALLLRGLLIFSMFFRIMSCNVTFAEKNQECNHVKTTRTLMIRNKDRGLHIDFGAPKLWSSNWCTPSHRSQLPCADSPPGKNKLKIWN